MTAAANPNELFEQAAKMFESALSAGLTVQRESTRWFTEAMERIGSPQQWQSRNAAVLEEAVVTARKNADQALDTMNENAKASLDLLDKAFRAGKPESAADLESRSREAMETAIGSFRKNMEAVLHANTRAVESWSQIARILMDQSAQKEAQPS